MAKTVFIFTFSLIAAGRVRRKDALEGVQSNVRSSVKGFEKGRALITGAYFFTVPCEKIHASVEIVLTTFHCRHAFSGLIG
jgi:hypothetical protein